MKCKADEICPIADFILHIDSDCVFTDNVTPDDYFVNGNPVLLYQSYESLFRLQGGATGGYGNWQNVTSIALGWKVLNETMRRHPSVHYRGIYKDMRDFITKRFGSFDEYVLSRKDIYPQGFTEFNTLGSFVEKFHNDKYHWINVEEPANRPKDKVLQNWSHFLHRNDIVKYNEIVSELEKILK
jgi:hypothetical protein